VVVLDIDVEPMGKSNLRRRRVLQCQLKVVPETAHCEGEVGECCVATAVLWPCHKKLDASMHSILICFVSVVTVLGVIFLGPHSFSVFGSPTHDLSSLVLHLILKAMP
jgi:hypothetical protein